MEHFSHDFLRSWLARLEPPRRLWIAYSGGLDSHALLHALAMVRRDGHIEDLRAVHVNHGLLPQADAWEAHCRSVCGELGVELTGLRVSVMDSHGGVEAAARRARYAAIEACLAPDDLVLTAHTEDDQAETLLLQMLRGAGPRGLAGMSPRRRLGRGWLLRPLLEIARAEVRAYARREGLRSVEDPSNEDSRFDRSYLRHELLPRLHERWPGASRVLARVASHQADLARLLEEVSASDLAEIASGGALSVPALSSLAPARRRSALRTCSGRLGLPPPSFAHLAQIERCLMRARADTTPLVRWPGAEARRYRDRIFLMKQLGPHEGRARLEWHLPEALRLQHGTLRAERAETPGLGLRATAEGVNVRFRRGGERIRRWRQGGSRSLKKLFQEAGVPPWLRARIPLIYVEETLAAIPGVLVCEDFASRDGEPAWHIAWRDDCDSSDGVEDLAGGCR